MNRQLIADLSWGVGILIVALVASFARKLGYVDTDTVTRVVIGLTGLMIASFGNLEFPGFSGHSSAYLSEPPRTARD